MADDGRRRFSDYSKTDWEQRFGPQFDREAWLLGLAFRATAALERIADLLDPEKRAGAEARAEAKAKAKAEYLARGVFLAESRRRLKALLAAGCRTPYDREFVRNKLPYRLLRHIADSLGRTPDAADAAAFDYGGCDWSFLTPAGRRRVGEILSRRGGENPGG